MANHWLPMLDETLQFDIGVYPSKLSSEMALTNVKPQACIVLPYPTGSDIGISGLFKLPANYVGTPIVLVELVLDGTPANVLAFGFQQIQIDEETTVDVAYETEDLVNKSSWTGYADEEKCVLSITVTPTLTYSPGKWIMWHLYRDDSVDTTTFNVLLMKVFFQYSDA